MGLEELERELYLKLKEKFEPEVKSVVVQKYIPGKKVMESSWTYRFLKGKFPDNSIFYEDYTEGGYLNTDYTTYYDAAGNKLYTKHHGNYS